MKRDGRGDEGAALDLLLDEELPDDFMTTLSACSVPTLEWLQGHLARLLEEKRGGT